MSKRGPDGANRNPGFPHSAALHAGDTPPPCTLVASAQQNHGLRSTIQIVDTVTRPVSDTHFHDAMTDAFGVPEYPCSMIRMPFCLTA